MDSLPPEKKKKVVASEYVKIIIMYGSYYPFNQEYIHVIEKEGEYPTSLWACVTTLYGGHDLCNDIHIQSGFTDCPTTSHSSCNNLISAL